jgi:hypothetical protein
MNTLRDLPFSGKPFLLVARGLDQGALNRALGTHAESSKVPALEGLYCSDSPPTASKSQNPKRLSADAYFWSASQEI